MVASNANHGNLTKVNSDNYNTYKANDADMNELLMCWLYKGLTMPTCKRHVNKCVSNTWMLIKGTATGQFKYME